MTSRPPAEATYAKAYASTNRCLPADTEQPFRGHLICAAKVQGLREEQFTSLPRGTSRPAKAIAPPANQG